MTLTRMGPFVLQSTRLNRIISLRTGTKNLQEGHEKAKDEAKAPVRREKPQIGPGSEWVVVCLDLANQMISSNVSASLI